MSLVIWICIYVRFIDDLLHYMDDSWSYDMNPTLVYYDPYKESYSSKQVALLRLWDDIGLPHSKNKQEFGPSLMIIGFWVNPRDMSITMPSESKADLIAAVRNFVDTSSVRRRPLVEWQRLLGWINWGLNCFPLLKPALQSSYEKISGKKFSHASIFLNREVIRDLKWLSDVLEDSDGICMLDAIEWPLENADLEIFCDSTLSNMAFYCPQANVAFCSPVPDNAPRGTIFYYEALAIVSALAWAAQRHHPPHRLVIRSDSLNSVEMFHTLKALSGYNTLLLFSVRILMHSKISLRVAHVSGDSNIIADAISRLLFKLVSEHHPGLLIKSFQPPLDALGATAL
ncbi:hypothetical protein K439DRAFT_1646329 [Ramaria rubella]|nr:hypothetical protein K439DRAFT_1646329 [Ramaria rubella]